MQDTLLLIGRLALVAIFLDSGLDKLGNLEAVAGMLGETGYPAPLALATFAAVAETLGAFALAIGAFTRAAAFGLAAFVLIASVGFHDYWSYADGERVNHYLHFMKNMGLIGGMLIVAAVGPGRFSADGHVRVGRLAWAQG